MKSGNHFRTVLGATLIFALPSAAVVNIQNTGAGARAAAMGNSFVAVADNHDAIFFNPAGLPQVEERGVGYTNVSLFYGGIAGDDLDQHLLSVVQPLGDKVSLGLAYERIGSNLMNENGAFLSLGYQMSRNFSLGLNGKYLFWSVGDIPPDNGVPDPVSGASAGGIGVDIGLLWQTPFSGAKIGLLAKNLNGPNVSFGSVKDSTGTVDSDAGKLPTDLAVGLSFPVSETTLLSVQWVARDLTGEEIDQRLVVGGETRLAEGLLLRAGGSRVFEDDVSGDVNAGLGYKFRGNMGFDYSYHIPLDLRETNGAHRFSLGYGF